MKTVLLNDWKDSTPIEAIKDRLMNSESFGVNDWEDNEFRKELVEFISAL